MLSVRSLLNKSVNACTEILKIQTRNTFILKRRWPPPLHKKGGRPGKFRGRHFVYDLVEDTNIVKKPDLKVILTEYVDGVGKVGDVISVRPNVAYQNYLLPGLAVYASPENLDKYKSTEDKKIVESKFSSIYAQRTMGCLSRLVLQIIMSKTEPWTLEPWHVRASFRKAGYVVPEHAIEMPPRPISGPDLSLQDKEFVITVCINKTEKVNVRSRIHHWAIGLERIPWEDSHWKKPKEPLFPEQAEILEQLPLPQ